MGISKAMRQKVYQKYNGRCAYCGEVIQYKDMQVDHFIAKRGWSEEGTDDFSNLMPSCRTCNHYKRANPLELFRRYIQEIPKKLRQNYIYKVGIRYKNVIENEKPIEFYFEKVAKKEGHCMKYRKKPVEVEAIQWTGSNISEIDAFMGADNQHVLNDSGTLYIDTLEGRMRADIGDMIIRGISGEYYPCKPDIFAQSYEEVKGGDER